jgi:hypothetical protein
LVDRSHSGFRLIRQRARPGQASSDKAPYPTTTTRRWPGPQRRR